MNVVAEVQTNDPSVYSKVLALIHDRYCSTLYSAVTSGDSEVTVFVSNPDVRPVRVVDAPRHTLLQRQLWETFGDNFNAGFASGDMLQNEGWQTLGWKIVPSGQVALCHAFLKDIPSFLRSLFPIASPQSMTNIEIGDIQLIPSDSEVSSRCIVNAELTLREVSTGRVRDSGRFGLCNFLTCGNDGRVVEPGQRVGRPFDEVNANFRHSITAWLSNEVRQNMENSEQGLRVICGFEDD